MPVEEIKLPVVDLAAADAAKVIATACKTTGFFLLVNPLPPKLVDDCFSQSRAFFGLAKEQKLAVFADAANRGYTPMLQETLDPVRQSKGDTKEGYYIFRELALGEAPQGPLEAPNRWPGEAILPGWRATMLKYYGEMLELGKRTARLLAEGVGLPADFFDPHFTRSMSALRLLHYAPEASDPDGGVFACGAHSDYGLLTLLATDDNPGLQVLLDGVWRDVPPQRGHLIVNIGDILQRWTNDELVSTTHRVVTRRSASGSSLERYSIPFFFEPNFDTVVAAPPPFVGPGRPAKYPPITSGQYLLGKYKQTYANFADGREEG